VSILDRAVAANRPSGPKILVIDIELRPGTAYYWQPKTEWINPGMVIDKPSMICFDAKWYGKPQHIFRSEWEHGAEEMVAEAWRLLDEAHIVIGYNSVGFDVKHLNREIVTSQSPNPPRPFFDVDLIRTARSRFKFPYNSMNEVCRDLGLDLKLEHSGWDLWLGVMNGDPKAQRTMAKYNRQDVVVNENLYTRLRAWVKNHPNVNMWTAESVSGCHVCTSPDVEPCGFKYTATRAYPMFVCNDCGAYSQATHSEPTMTQHRKGA
jgi:hypothetical protein